MITEGPLELNAPLVPGGVNNIPDLHQVVGATGGQLASRGHLAAGHTKVVGIFHQATIPKQISGNQN